MDQSTAVRAVSQELNAGDRNGRSTRLARLTGASVATIRSWGASGASEERKRAMTPTARRLLFVLLALKREGHDLDALRSAARRLEREYLEEDA
jgi:cob(I)alamin adenosyltransferase